MDGDNVIEFNIKEYYAELDYERMRYLEKENISLKAENAKLHRELEWLKEHYTPNKKYVLWQCLDGLHDKHLHQNEKPACGQWNVSTIKTDKRRPHLVCRNHDKPKSIMLHRLPSKFMFYSTIELAKKEQKRKNNE
jgi:hypothetical protein